MKRKLSLVIVVAMMISLVIALQSASAMTVTNSTITLGCTSYDFEFDWAFDRDNTGSGEEAYYIEVTDGAGKVLRYHSNSWAIPDSGHDGPDTINYSALPDYNPITYRLVSVAGNGLDEQLVDQATGECPGLPYADVAGRDMVDLPAQAVVGTFVQNTPLLYAPDAAATTDTVLEIGKTLWVLGVDSSGQFYQVLMSGNKAWVPVSSMGPNFDEVWNGTPLPTTVVE